MSEPSADDKTPILSVFERMQAILRDTAASLEKRVNLNWSGEETALERKALDLLSDPLLHLVRNAIDHGIESNEERVASGKTEIGLISLSAYSRGEKLVIEVEDDGGGIDPGFLVKRGVEKGVLRSGDVLSRKEAIDLIFHPGFSTKAAITEISGRGIGLDVVRANIEKLSGEIEIDSTLGRGTVFRILLPLSLSSGSRPRQTPSSSKRAA